MTTLKGSMGARINKSLEKVEEKKKKRAARRAQVSVSLCISKICWYIYIYLHIPLCHGEGTG